MSAFHPDPQQPMSSRERVLAALDHRSVDRVPIDLSGHRSSGIAAIAYARLRRHLDLPPRPVRVYDPIQQLAIVDDDVLERFHVDTVELGRAFAREEEYWRDWVLPDGTACQMPAWALPERHAGEWILRSSRGTILARMPDGALYFEQCHFPLMDQPRPDTQAIRRALEECMWTAVHAPPGPLVEGPDGMERLREGARRLRASTDRAIVGLFGGNLLEVGQFLFRNDRFFLMLAGDPQDAHAFLDQLTEIHLENLEHFLEAVGPYIDVVLFGDDLGMQAGPQLSPAMYRAFFKPRHSRLWHRAKELAGARVMLHSCGSVRALIPDLIEAGLDALNPVQTNCAGMELGGLLRDFGQRLTLWGGGCDTQEVLPHASPQEIEAHVRERLRLAGREGGFVFQQVHNILADVPPDHIVSMLDAAHSA